MGITNSKQRARKPNNKQLQQYKEDVKYGELFDEELFSLPPKEFREALRNEFRMKPKKYKGFVPWRNELKKN